MAKTLKEFELEQGAPAVATVDNTPSDAGQTPVKEPVVIIDGKERPLKNYEAELRRKSDEEKELIKKEYERKLLDLQQQPSNQPQSATQQDWYSTVVQRAEQEMAITGKAVPLQTIMEVAQSLYNKNISETLKTREQSEKLVRSFKRSVKNDPDFKDIEDGFDELVEQLEPHQVNAPTLEVILNSVRGKKLNEIVRKAKEQGKEEALKDTQILGSGIPVEVRSGGSTPKTSLSAEQLSDLNRMNSENQMEWTEKEYMEALVRKQNRFKAAGAKNIPQTLNDVMIR